jgi:hypothetical protein
MRRIIIMMKTIRSIAMLIIILSAVIFVLGCAEKSKALLSEDYKTMSDENILRYYYNLSDEIERQEKQSSPQFSIGIGSFGREVGGGIGVGTGGSGYTADDLRARRIDVRLELKRRGLNP